MAVTGIGIQSHIGHDRHLGDIAFELTNRPGNESVFVEAFSAVFRLETFSDLGEQHHTTHAQIPGALNLAAQCSEAPSVGSRHRRNRLDISAFVDKKRINEIGCRQAVLTHHSPQRRGTTQSARAVCELHFIHGSAADRNAKKTQREA